MEVLPNNKTFIVIDEKMLYKGCHSYIILKVKDNHFHFSVIGIKVAFNNSLHVLTFE